MKRNNMKNLVAFIAVVCFLINSAFAQTSSVKEKSLLWKIEGKDLKAPSYLFGTVHMLARKNFEMSAKATDAMDKTSRVYLEINMAAPNLAEESQKYMMSHKTISSQIKPEEIALVDEVLGKKLGLTLAQVDKVKPMFLIAMIMQKSFTEPMASFEEEIIKHTKQQGKTIEGLSSIEEQYSFADKIFETSDFPSYLKSMDEFDIQSILSHIYQLYKDENIAGMDELLLKYTSSNPETYRQLLPVRNRLWADRMPALMNETPTFFAIGSAHLSGEEGVINLLRQKGYTVTPVYN
ncbi:GumN protein [Sphingobacterium spiritivorum ATCC 33300]|uniref:GumN protein n=1 Tax=Sphingobacterium spiritivorum ATCC 33300 TaxID=525372 RepID=C2G090_SPHSI|nr:TraB/GumN family protein [Sphingobacterium spiritivorum]EEI91270.1 GumN protein [Sphingobacterium spiritivorum ATCC 33300]QQS97380.1 TraB/GumN family protein [Sphingobacterium spiritivorum]